MNSSTPLHRAHRPGTAALVLRSLASSLSAVVAFCALPASAQTIDPFYAASYSLNSIGAVPGVPSPLGGLTFKAGSPNTILIGGTANSSAAKIYSINVVRGPDGHITGFSGTAVEVASGAGEGFGGIDGGLDYGPGEVLFYTSYSDNRIEQLKPGSTVSDKSINATTLGIGSSVGALYFVPEGLPGAGKLKILSYNTSNWYDAEVQPDGTGTYNIVNVGTAIAIGVAADGPEGAISVAAGNPGFTNHSVLVASYRSGKIIAYEVDANGDPLVATARTFITGLTGAEGAVIDPLTNDFLFSTFGGGDQVVVVRGFVPPPPPTEPILTTIWRGAKAGGDPVPGAGTDPRIEAGATFVKFGVPAENDDGGRAFVASWVAPESKGTGIFAGNPESLVVALNDPAPGTSGLFSVFKDPMLNNAGRVAFIGKAKGAGVTPGDDSAVWTNAFSPGGALAIAAREGAPAPGVTDAIFKSFKSVALGDAGLGFTAFMAEGPGGVTKDDDLGLWIDAGFGAVLVAREGQVLPEGTVKKFTALLPGPVTRGHGNGVGTRANEVLLGIDEELGDIVLPADESVVNVRVQFVSGAQALYQATVLGLTLVAESGDQAAGYDPGVKFSKFGIPGSAHNGRFAFLAKSKGPGVTGANGTSVNVWDDTDIVHVVSNGDDAPGVSGATFKAFKDPAANGIGGVVFAGKMAGSAVDTFRDEGIWWKQPFGQLVLAAREGSIAPGTADVETEEHALFDKFRSVALPEHGRPVFIAKLRVGTGGTTKSNDDGAWAVGPFGEPQLLVREGQQYDGKTVKKIVLLSAVSGSSTQTRGHNAARHLLMRLDFVEGGQVIVDALLPEELLN